MQSFNPTNISIHIECWEIEKKNEKKNGKKTEKKTEKKNFSFFFSFFSIFFSIFLYMDVAIVLKIDYADVIDKGNIG